MQATCEDAAENKLVVLAAGECLRLAAVVEASSPVGLARGELAEEWMRAAHSLGGLTLVYACRGEWGLVSRLYLPVSFSFSRGSAAAGARGDAEILRAWALAAVRGGEALRSLEGPLAEPRGYQWRLGGPHGLAVAGVECLPPYARRG